MNQCPECEGYKFDYPTQQCYECGYDNNKECAHAADNYNECCASGRQQDLCEPPVEDAHHLAEEA